MKRAWLYGSPETARDVDPEAGCAACWYVEEHVDLRAPRETVYVEVQGDQWNGPSRLDCQEVNAGTGLWFKLCRRVSREEADRALAVALTPPCGKTS